MIDIQLNYQLYHQWKTENNISVLGSAFLSNELLDTSKLILFFKDVLDEESFKSKLQKLSGHFAIILTLENCILASVDLIRTIPIFFQQNNQTIIVTDKINTDVDFDNNEIEKFKKVYCTLENNTLLKNWKQLQAGEYLMIDKINLTVDIKTYYHHSKETKKIDDIEHKIKVIEEEIVNQTIKYANNRPILVPLSGGYDSRYILALLKQSNYEKIECFTYGKKNSYEVLIAKNVAEKLNIKWHFIEYTDELLDTFFTDVWQQYSSVNQHFTSLPHEQDFFALHYLNQNNLIAKDTVVINGFCQDIHAGSFIEPINNFDLEKFIFYKHDLHLDVSSYENSWNGYQEWLVKNRLSKFIINAVRVYEFFDLDFYLPFWNKNWIDFWYSMDIDLRRKKKFYNDYLFNGIFKQYNIDFKKPNHDENIAFYTLKKIAKSILPKKITAQIQTQNNLNKQNDVNNTLYLYNKIFLNLNEQLNNKDYKINNIHAIYFIEKLKHQLKI